MGWPHALRSLTLHIILSLLKWGYGGVSPYWWWSPKHMMVDTRLCWLSITMHRYFSHQYEIWCVWIHIYIIKHLFFYVCYLFFYIYIYKFMQTHTIYLNIYSSKHIIIHNNTNTHIFQGPIRLNLVRSHNRSLPGPRTCSAVMSWSRSSRRRPCSR